MPATEQKQRAQRDQQNRHHQRVSALIVSRHGQPPPIEPFYLILRIRMKNSSGRHISTTPPIFACPMGQPAASNPIEIRSRYSTPSESLRTAPARGTGKTGAPLM